MYVCEREKERHATLSCFSSDTSPKEGEEEAGEEGRRVKGETEGCGDRAGVES